MVKRICPNCGHELDGHLSEIGVCYNCGEYIAPRDQHDYDDEYNEPLYG